MILKGEMSSMPFDKTLFETNFDFPFRVAVANNVRIATNAFNSFWLDNSEFLSDADELYGRILAYAVRHQFLKTASFTANHYIVAGADVNSYKTKALFLNTPDYITHICRTDRPQQLPCKARYKLQLASGNREDTQQLEFSFSDSNLQVISPKRYALLTYCYKDGTLKHLTLVVPDWRFESIIHSESLLGQISEFYQYIPEEIVEENVASLKKELVKLVENTKISGE